MTTTTKTRPRVKVAPKKTQRLQFARAIEASVAGEAPEAARIWKAGWNRTDKGDLNFTPRSAELVLQAAADRGNPLAWYYEHEDRIPLEKRGGAPMKGVCAAPSSVLAIRDSDEGPECWAEQIAWTDEARRQIKTGERRQLSPIAAFDAETREVIEILNMSLCAEGATANGTILASAGKGMQSMDDLIQALLDALNAGDFEAAENIVQNMEAQEGGGAMAKMARGMMSKMAKDTPADAPPPAAPPPEDTAKRQLAASREHAAQFQSEAFTRSMAKLDEATAKAEAAAKRSDRATVITLIAASRDLFDTADEREHIGMADPVATERHINSMRRKVAKTGILAASKGVDAKPEAKPPNDKPDPATDNFGLDAIEIGVAMQTGVTLEAFAAAKERSAKPGRKVVTS